MQKSRQVILEEKIFEKIPINALNCLCLLAFCFYYSPKLIKFGIHFSIIFSVAFFALFSICLVRTLCRSSDICYMFISFAAMSNKSCKVKNIFICYNLDIDCYMLLVLWVRMGNWWLISCIISHYQKETGGHVWIQQNKLTLVLISWKPSILIRKSNILNEEISFPDNKSCGDTGCDLAVLFFS